MKLVIVESPAKCKTIQKYLGDEYKVVASKGHICDLATSGKEGLGVDIENSFAPTYIINKNKYALVNELKKECKSADEVILATDPDREGEAIAWHLARVLGLNSETTKRLEFHEITNESINYSINNPRTIDSKTVQSQETRRILDRIVGFKTSTLLKKKIRSKSAGRVQSAVLKIIADHEKDIENFVSEEYWVINVKIKLGDEILPVSFVGLKDTKKDVLDQSCAEDVVRKIPSTLKVTDVKKVVKVKEPKPPFTTSTLQQEAFSRYKFKTKFTQSIIQKLYEGIDVDGEHVGLITYIRTDFARLSPVFVEKANDFISNKYGNEFLGNFKGAKKEAMVQGAHEGIRQTSNERTPESIKKYLTREEYLLYKLIYERTLASLMKGKKNEVLFVSLSGNDLLFKFELSHCIFPGYEKILKDNDDEYSYSDNLPDIKVDDCFEVAEKNSEQKFTQPPAHYTEGKIVKTMEELGIGRPSTYASTIDTLLKRKYVKEEKGSLLITEQGKLTSIVLDKYFPKIVESKYTANMESKLDDVERGTHNREETLNDFYSDFMKYYTIAVTKMYEEEYVEIGEKCPKCGAPLVIKQGKNGEFIGCSNYPKCHYIKKEEKVEKLTGEMCPQCGKPLVERKDKNGNIFIACSNYPKCYYTKNSGESGERYCPKCGSLLLRKKGKFGIFLGCSNYPTCKYIEKIKRDKPN